MYKTINIFFLIFSIILYFWAPAYYDFNYCLVINFAFIIQNFLYFTITKRSLISFEFFFMFAFYFVNFIYPVAYFPTDPTFGVFELTFNYQIICKATSIAYVAFTCYMFGLTLIRPTTNDEIKFDSSKLSTLFYNIILFFFLLISISYIVSVGADFFNGYDWYTDESNSSPFVSFINLFGSLLAMFVFFIQKTFRKSLYLFILVLFVIIYLLSGSRNMPLGILIILLVAFNDYVKKIPSTIFLSALVIGLFIFSIIGDSRIDGIIDSSSLQVGVKGNSGITFFDFAKDLVYNNRNLYVLVDFADNNGLTYGMTMLSSIIGIIPFLGTFISETFGIPPDFMYAAGFNTYLEFGFGSKWGLGGNIVADIYLSFGFIGVIISFTLLGLFVSKVIRNYKSDIRYHITYFTMASLSVFMVRESFLLPLRGIVYSLIVYWLLNKYNFIIKSDNNISKNSEL